MNWAAVAALLPVLPEAHAAAGAVLGPALALLAPPGTAMPIRRAGSRRGEWR